MRAEYPCLASPAASVRVQAPWLDLFGWGEAVAGIAQGVATITAAEKQANAAREAAKITADAANHGADLQDAAAQRNEAFLREQADYTAHQAEVDRRANYGQYASNRRRIGSISQALGLGGVEVPEYVPGVESHFSNAPAPAGPSGWGGPPPPGATSGPQGAPPPPLNFGAALAGGAAAAGQMAPPPGSAPTPEDLAALRANMGGNTGIFNPGAPKLQPDGTYAIPDSMPPRYRTFGQYLGAA